MMIRSLGLSFVLAVELNPLLERLRGGDGERHGLLLRQRCGEDVDRRELEGLYRVGVTTADTAVARTVPSIGPYISFRSA